MTGVQIEIIDNESAFSSLANEWRELLSDSDANAVFLTWEWMFTWWRHFAGGRSLWIIAVRKDGCLIALAPLAIARGQWRRFGLPTVEFLGTRDVGADYLDVIVRRGFEAAARDAVIEAMAQRRLTIDARRLPSSSTIGEVASRLSQAGWS